MSACATVDGTKSSTTGIHASSVGGLTVALPVSESGRFEEVKRSSKQLSTKRESVAGLTGDRKTSNEKQYNTRTLTHTHTHTHGRGIITTRYLPLSKSKCECVKHDVHSRSRVTRTHQHKYT